MTLRAFPVLYAKDVERLAGFYTVFGFEIQSRIPGEDGSIGFVALRRGSAEMGITTEASPRILAGVEPGIGPRHEMFVYVSDLDATVAAAASAGGSILRAAADMPWGERLAYLRDPEGNLVTVAASLSQT